MRIGLLALLFALVGCSQPASQEVARGDRAQASPRVATSPSFVPATIESGGPIGAVLRTAVADLRRAGFWHRLTAGVDVVEIGSRGGRDDVPGDGHLADSFVAVGRGSDATVCDVMFYPAAVAADLVRWRGYWRGDRIGRPPPTRREYWAVLLGHELVHCLPRNSGERAAARWEWRIRRALDERQTES